MIARLKKLLGRLRPAPPTPMQAPLPPPPTMADEITQAGGTLAGWLAARRASNGRLYSSLPDDRIRSIAERSPDLVKATIAAADRVCRHEFDLLGSGPYTPSDPSRPPVGTYQPIDWYIDPIQGLRFPERVPYKSWNLLEMRPGLADVKLPWELGRCQHWVPLAQAFAIGRDEKFATEILDQHDDFIAANPIGFGINWTCTMDVAIRALNWAIAVELIHPRTSAPAARLERLYTSLFDTGVFIEGNLENHYEVTSNHFLSNVVGLYGVALLFRDLPSGQRWLCECRGWLEQEMRIQVLPDGADYESSVPYHRLVAELFLAGWRIAELEGTPLSGEYHDKLRAMLVFLHDVLRPDGTVPQVGDADDGRVHIFSNYGRWTPQDARHIFAPAAAVFNQPSWMATGDPWADWEATWWGLESPAATGTFGGASRLFPDAGLALIRDVRNYLLITNGRVGTNGFGNHKHNDLLSFEYHDRGRAVIVDPGSYVYTSNPEARNQFRSTMGHNTLSIDREEQNEFKPEWLFRMFAKAQPEHLEFVVDAVRSRYRGRHDGYARLPQPVVHERSFELEHGSGVLQITDRLTGEGAHALAWRFHCAPGVTAAITGEGALSLRSGGKAWLLRSLECLPAAIHDGWYSPSYGVRLPAKAVEFRIDQQLSRQHEWTFRLEPQS